MNPRRGFSLIELLIVISIIAMLISVLLPALKTARDSARLSTCLSQMRQNGIAAYAYANDNDYFTPYGSFEGWRVFAEYMGATGLNGNYSLTNPKMAEFSKSGIWVCPAAADAFGPGNRLGFQGTFAANRELTNSSPLRNSFAYITRFDGPEAPSQTALLVDASMPYNVGSTNNMWWEHVASGFNSRPPLMPHFPAGELLPQDGGFFYENGSGNFLFFDGHAKTLKPDDVAFGGAQPFDRPAGGQQSEWNMFWNGNNAPSAY